MSLELTFLGTGTSAGVPMIGCDCGVCRSKDPRDQRSRPSVLIRYPDPEQGIDRQWIIDTAPELRQQVIRHGLERIDGVLYTHAHADHIFGIDDLRRFNAVMEAPINIYAEDRALEALRRMFSYIFEPHKNVNRSFVASLVPHTIEAGRAFDLFGATWTPIRLLHGRLPILGFRIEHNGQRIAYCTDASSLPPEAFGMLENLDVLVLDALRYRHHPTHMTVDRALETIDRIRPARAYLTHIAHDIRHADLEARLPEHVYLSFDGLVVTCGVAASS